MDDRIQAAAVGAAEAVATADVDVEWEQVTYLLAPTYRVVEEDDGWRVFKRVTVTNDGT